MAKKSISYDEAIGRVEKIVDTLEENETSLDQLADNIREAQQLLDLCKKKMVKVESEINQLFQDNG